MDRVMAFALRRWTASSRSPCDDAIRYGHRLATMQAVMAMMERVMAFASSSDRPAIALYFIVRGARQRSRPRVNRP
jgi:hypothetical protein